MPKLKRILLGKPLATFDEQHQRLSKKTALPIFASDAISSTAYAVDEMLVVIVLQAGVGFNAFRPVTPIAIVVCVLLAIVITSYRQTIMAYPQGGGAYIVSRENLGVYPSLVAGASLLIDYILTVAVSTAGGVLAIRTAFQLDESWAVPLCLACITVLTVLNLRGLREAGVAFAGPTYFYIVMLVMLIGTGFFRIFVRHLPPIPDEMLSADGAALGHQTASLSVYMLLRAFSSGAVALSGVEAVANGVQSFKKPESRNASVTLIWMGTILGTCFLGFAVLASHLQPFRGENDGNMIGLMAEYVYGGRNVLYWMTLIATFVILVLAANTAYAGFPALSSIIARDGFIPRQFFNRGAKLVFSNGVLFLAVVAAILVGAFGGDISALIPLYAFGVFSGFTLSQAGMVRHHLRHRQPGWRWGLVINAIGTLATFAIAIVVVVSKFTEGAWIPAVVIPLMVLGFRKINRHYANLREVGTVAPGYRPRRETHTMVVLVGAVNRGVLDALGYAKSLHPDRIRAFSVATDDEERQALQRQWDEYDLDVELEVVLSKYRELTGPVVAYLDELDAEYVGDIITVVIPETVTSWRTQWLHNQSALALKAKLLYRPHTAVVSVPTHMWVPPEAGTPPAATPPDTMSADLTPPDPTPTGTALPPIGTSSTVGHEPSAPHGHESAREVD